MSIFKQYTVASIRAKAGEIARARRTRRWARRLVIAIVVFGLLGFFAVPPLVHHRAEQALSEALGRPVSIGQLSLNPYTLSLRVGQLHVGEPGAGTGSFVDLDELVVRASWTSLFRLKPVLREVFLARLKLHLVRSDAQTFNFSDLVERYSKPSAPPPKDSAPTLFSVSNIHMDDGEVDFDDRLLGAQHVVDKIELSIPFIANLPSKVDIFSQPLLQARIDGSPLQIEGKTKPFNGSFDSDVRVKLERLALSPLLPYSPAKLALQLPTGTLSSDLDIRFAMNGEHASLQVGGTLDLNDLVLNDAAGAPLFSVDALHLAADAIEPLAGVAHLSDLRIDHPQLALSMDGQGSLNLLKLVPAAAVKPAAATPASPTAATAPPAAKPAPFDFSLRQLALNDGTLHWQDRRSGAELGLSKLSLSLGDATTLTHRPAHYTLQAGFDAGGSLSSSGTLVLSEGRAEAEAALDQLALAPFQPYLAAALQARLTQGSAGAKLAFRADWSGAEPDLELGPSELRLDDLRLDAAASMPLLSLEHAGAAIRRLDLAQRQAELSSVEVAGLNIAADRAPDGSINLLRLVAAPGAPTAHHPAAPSSAASPNAGKPWTYGIDSIELGKSALSLVDHAGAQPVTLNLSALQLKLQHFGSDFSAPLQLDGAATFMRQGALKLGGTLTLDPLKLALHVQGHQLDMATLQPYFAGQLNAVIASALLGVNGDLTLAGGPAGLKVNYAGAASLGNVRMLDKLSSDLFAGWRSLELSQIKAAYDGHTPDVQVGNITLSDFYSRVLLNSDGRLNLDDLIAKQNAPTASLTRATGPEQQAQQAQAAASAPPAAAAPPLKLAFGQILMQRGKIDYSDNFIRPNFSAHLVGIQGSVGAFGSASTTPAPVAVQATLNDNGPVSINGTINPLVQPPSLDLTASSSNIDLTNFTSYSLKYAGYPIVKGKLNVDLHYQLDHNKLNANNHLFIDQFTFGDHVDSPDATGLPVRLAISLLKNSRGEIDVNIPVSGSLDDPQFSVGSLIWHAFLNVIEKAVSSPFSLLAGAFGGSEELGYVAFEPGSATLSAAETKKLDTLAKALADRPGISLDLAGRVDPALDTPGLKQASLERQVRRQKLQDLLAKGESIDVDSVTVDPAEYGKYLQRAYDAASIKKPRNFIGIAKSLPADQMRQLLLDNVVVGEAELAALAQQRAGTVQLWFGGRIDASRIFTVAPKMNAAGITDKGPATRVEFKLK